MRNFIDIKVNRFASLEQIFEIKSRIIMISSDKFCFLTILHNIPLLNIFFGEFQLHSYNLIIFLCLTILRRYISLFTFLKLNGSENS